MDSAKLSAKSFDTVFGVISPKIRTITVIITVEIMTISPRNFINSTVLIRGQRNIYDVVSDENRGYQSVVIMVDNDKNHIWLLISGSGKGFHLPLIK